MQRLLPPVLTLFCLLFMLALYPLLPIMRFEHYHLPGAILIAAGLAITVIGSQQFRKAATNIKTFNDPDRMVTNGLFAVSRNPMYLGFTVFLLGAALSLGTLSAFLIALAFFVIANFWYIPFEEARMEETFGEAYLTYKDRVRRWL